MDRLYFKNQLVELYCGDCLGVMSQLDITFDACISDPPYQTTHNMWDSILIEKEEKYCEIIKNRLNNNCIQNELF